MLSHLNILGGIVSTSKTQKFLYDTSILSSLKLIMVREMYNTFLTEIGTLIIVQSNEVANIERRDISSINEFHDSAWRVWPSHFLLIEQKTGLCPTAVIALEGPAPPKQDLQIHVMWFISSSGKPPSNSCRRHLGIALLAFAPPPPALKRALWGTFFRADLSNFVKSPFWGYISATKNPGKP